MLKPGDRVPIRKGAKYNGKDVDWTEPQTDHFITDEEMVIYHNSGFLGRKIEEFLPKKTCFYSEKPKCEAHHYALVVPAGTHVEVYEDSEVCTEYRVTLTEEMEMYYLGEMERDGYERIGKYSGRSVRKTYYNDNTIDFQSIERRQNK